MRGDKYRAVRWPNWWSRAANCGHISRSRFLDFYFGAHLSCGASESDCVTRARDKNMSFLGSDIKITKLVENYLKHRVMSGPGRWHETGQLRSKFGIWSNIWNHPLPPSHVSHFLVLFFRQPRTINETKLAWLFLGPDKIRQMDKSFGFFLILRGAGNCVIARLWAASKNPWVRHITCIVSER